MTKLTWQPATSQYAGPLDREIPHIGDLTAAARTMTTWLPPDALPLSLDLQNDPDPGAVSRCEHDPGRIVLPAGADAAKAAHELAHLALFTLTGAPAWAEASDPDSPPERFARALQVKAAGPCPPAAFDGDLESCAGRCHLYQLIALRNRSLHDELDNWLAHRLHAGTAQGLLALHSIRALRARFAVPAGDQATRAVLGRWLQAGAGSTSQIEPVYDLLSAGGAGLPEETVWSALLHAWRRLEPQVVEGAGDERPELPALVELSWNGAAHPAVTALMLRPSDLGARGAIRAIRAPPPGFLVAQPTHRPTGGLALAVWSALEQHDVLGLGWSAWPRQSAAATWARVAAVASQRQGRDQTSRTCSHPDITEFLVIGSDGDASPWRTALDRIIPVLPVTGRPKIDNDPRPPTADWPTAPGATICDRVLVLPPGWTPDLLDRCRRVARRGDLRIRGIVFAPPTRDALARCAEPADAPAHPHYFEGTWQPDPSEPHEDHLVRAVFRATVHGEPTTPLSWLFAWSRWNHGELDVELQAVDAASDGSSR